jgi:TonB-dependent SusC/RagA subfamily outer membrane receptor
MVKRLLVILAVLLRLSVLAFSQADTSTSKKYDNDLKLLLVNGVSENAYLHFDKPYYAAGDTIYFKAYVTVAGRHIPSKLSGILHVDLINPSNNIDQSLKLQLLNGVAWGDFTLADSLPKGNYRIRAYTRWMRNMGDDTFFDQVIPVGSVKAISAQAIKKTMQGIPDIQFFPEGGELLEGINTKIAFKAIATNGMGIDAKGIVSDNSSNEVVQFSPVHLGMGFFYLKPEAGKSYTARVIYGNGIEAKVNLPKVNSRGMVLTAGNDSLDKVVLKILASKAYFEDNKHNTYTVKILSGGKTTMFTGKLDYETMRFDVRKKNLSTGIALITLYNAKDEPVSERPVFIQSPDLLNINISSDKKEYNKRNNVNISINVQNQASEPKQGSFSVSVTDESKVKFNVNTEHTILTNMLLTNDVKGYVEQPNYYFAEQESERIKHLDILLLTQGYRSYIWKVQADSIVKYQPESYLEIAGNIKEKSSKKPVGNGIVSLTAPDGGPVISQTSNAQGGFAFPELMFNNLTRFLISGTTSKGSSEITISFDKEVLVPVSNGMVATSADTADVNARVTNYMENDKKVKENLQRYGLIGGKMLNEVSIKSIKTTPPYRTLSYAGAGNADYVLHMKNVHTGGQLNDILSGRIGGVYFIKGVPYLLSTPGMGIRHMFVVVDGMIMQGASGDFTIDNINANDVETVEVLKGANAVVYGMNAGTGVLVITTKQGTGLKNEDIESKGVFPVVVKGFYIAKQFYMPRYDTPSIVKPVADLRFTIFWKPDITTDKDGNASFNFYNADGIGNYRVVIEGIDGDGNIGRQVYRYVVK